MQTRKCTLLTLALAMSLAFGAAALAAGLPTEGTFSGTFSGVGTYKAFPVGKERLLLVFDENDLQLTNGLLDHTTVHCWGLGDATNGTGADRGYCVLTDPEGDQVVASISDEKHALGQKSVSGSGTFTSGTGKYQGISGGWTNVNSGNEFRPTTEGTYFTYGAFQANYKLP